MLALAALNVTVLLVTMPFYGQYGLIVDWRTFVPSIVAIGLATVAWLSHVSTPGRPAEWAIAESFVAFILIAFCCMVITPAQYLAVALKRPLADAWLAQADALLGLSVPAAVNWTRTHSWLASP